MKFSILMSVYYKEDPIFLEESLKSICNQTIMPDEIVLVKDGHLNERLDEVINKYLKKYKDIFNIVALEKNSGLGIALNKGLDLCKNELVARMDTDDIAVNDRFEKQIKEFERDKDLSMVGGLIKEFDLKIDDVKSIRYVPEKDEEIKSKLKRRNCFNHMTVMFKKKDVIAVGGYMDCPYFEDYFLWCRMAINNSKFYNIQEILVNARTGNDMLKRRGGLKYIGNIRNFYKKIYKLKFIKYYEYMINVFLRSIVSIVPNSCRKHIYATFLRKKD